MSASDCENKHSTKNYLEDKDHKSNSVSEDQSQDKLRSRSQIKKNLLLF